MISLTIGNLAFQTYAFVAKVRIFTANAFVKIATLKNLETIFMQICDTSVYSIKRVAFRALLTSILTVCNLAIR